MLTPVCIYFLFAHLKPLIKFKYFREGVLQDFLTIVSDSRAAYRYVQISDSII